MDGKWYLVVFGRQQEAVDGRSEALRAWASGKVERQPADLTSMTPTAVAGTNLRGLFCRLREASFRFETCGGSGLVTMIGSLVGRPRMKGARSFPHGTFDSKTTDPEPAGSSCIRAEKVCVANGIAIC